MHPRIDLHTHSIYSDGKLTPLELLSEASKYDLDIFALTDHDNIDGVALALQTLDFGRIKFIPGIELTCIWNKEEIHIVGLGIEIHNAALQQVIKHNVIERNLRMKNIEEKLNKVFQEDFTLSPSKGITTRLHYAEELIIRHKVKDIKTAFNKYLTLDEVNFPLNWISISSAIDAIHEAHGVAVLAHPMKYGFNLLTLNELCCMFVNLSGDGIELLKQGSSPLEYAWLRDFILQHKIYASIGSDFHSLYQRKRLRQKLTLPSQIKPIWHTQQLSKLLDVSY